MTEPAPLTLAPPTLDGGVESVTRHLRDLILRGQIPTGPVSQVQLARQLGVSRTPLREAIRMLQNEGLLTGEMNHRVYVPPLSLTDLDELYALRITVETLAVRLSVPHLTGAEFTEMQRLLDQMTELLRDDDLKAYETGEAAHAAFHLSLTRHAGERLRRQVQQLHDHTDRYRYAYISQRITTAQDSRAAHEAILTAARSQNTGLTTTLLARHYASTVISLIALIEPTFEPVCTRTALKQASV